jgi:hypothetical protein
MFFILPILAFIFIAILLTKITDENPYDRRDIFLQTSVLWALLIVFSTEILSLFYIFSLIPLIVFWTLVILITSYLIIRAKNRSQSSPILTGFNIQHLIPLFFIILILLIVGITALVAPPNTYDSMTYHMSRVAHWVQNQSVHFYPTNCSRQLWVAPGLEFIITQFQILSGSDRFANMVQWFGLLGSAISVSLIAKLLGATTCGQMLSSLFAVTLPMAVVQGSSTQSDLISGFWTTCFVYFLLKTRRSFQLRTALLTGCSFGLSLLTKGTILVYGLPFLVFFLFSGIKKRQTWITLALIFALTASINAGYFIRNYQLGGHILSPHAESQNIKNSSINIPLTISNILRNAGIHMGTSSDKINSFTNDLMKKTHNLLGIDLNEPDITFALSFPFSIDKPSVHEDYAPNPSHFILLIFTLVLALFLIGNPQTHFPLTFYALIILGFVLFCATVKWQPWHSRFHLTLFLLSGAFLGAVFSSLNLHRVAKQIVFFVLAILLFASSITALINNPSRRLISKKKPTIFNTPRNEQYFSNYPTRKSDYITGTDFIKSQTCHNIGLISHGESWEYPVWPLLNFTKIYRIEHIEISDPLIKKYEYRTDFDPCLAIDLTGKGKKIIQHNGTAFTRVFNSGSIDIFARYENAKSETKHMLKQFRGLIKSLEIPVENIGSNEIFMATIERFNREIYLAEDIDPVEMDKIIPGLGKSLNESLFPAMQARLAGLYRQDLNLMNQGHNVILNWLQSYNQQKQLIESVFEKHLAD